MNDLRILYLCNHDVVTRVNDVADESVIRGQLVNTPQMDKLVSVPNIIGVSKITQVVNGSVIELSPEIYNYYDGYIIWTRAYSPTATGKYRVPANGETFNVSVAYINAERDIYTKDKCPRCAGTGWYLNPIDEGTDLSKSSGPMRVAQEFLKCLLTVRNTDPMAEQFGAGLLSSSGILYLNNDITQYIESAVKNAETQCKSTKEIRPSNEMLDKAIIESIVTDTDSSGVFVTIRLVTLDSKDIKFTVTV